MLGMELIWFLHLGSLMLMAGILRNIIIPFAFSFFVRPTPFLPENWVESNLVSMGCFQPIFLVRQYKIVSFVLCCWNILLWTDCSYSNLVYILIFLSLELCLCFDAASQFKRGDGRFSTSKTFSTVAGAFAFTASILGYYTVLHYLCEESLPVSVPMGDTSRYFKKCTLASGKANDDLV